VKEDGSGIDASVVASNVIVAKASSNSSVPPVVSTGESDHCRRKPEPVTGPMDVSISQLANELSLGPSTKSDPLSPPWENPTIEKGLLTKVRVLVVKAKSPVVRENLVRLPKPTDPDTRSSGSLLVSISMASNKR
jgi:hypothetical protein